jgi:hypothetical protein
MFEMIGLVIGSLILLVLAGIVGCVFAGITWAILWNRAKFRILLMLLAVAIPVISAGYLWLCAAMLPGESLFGDIDEPLPNGYSLQALAKMPDFASIKRDDGSWTKDDVYPTQYIGRVGVYGALVVGQYSHPFGSFTADPDEPFFAFDTNSAKNVDYPRQDALEAAIGHKVALSQVNTFQSQEPRSIQRRRRNKIVEDGPPIAITTLFFLFVIRFRLSQRHAVPPLSL